MSHRSIIATSGRRDASLGTALGGLWWPFLLVCNPAARPSPFRTKRSLRPRHSRQPSDAPARNATCTSSYTRSPSNCQRRGSD